MRILIAEDDAVSRRVLEDPRNQLAMRLAVAERLQALRARLAELERR